MWTLPRVRNHDCSGSSGDKGHGVVEVRMVMVEVRVVAGFHTLLLGEGILHVNAICLIRNPPPKKRIQSAASHALCCGVYDNCQLALPPL